MLGDIDYYSSMTSDVVNNYILYSYKYKLFICIEQILQYTNTIFCISIKILLHIFTLHEIYVIILHI